MLPPPPRSPLFPYTTLFRSRGGGRPGPRGVGTRRGDRRRDPAGRRHSGEPGRHGRHTGSSVRTDLLRREGAPSRDRKSTRLNSSHRCSSYAVFCLKKKTHAQTSHRTDKAGFVLGAALLAVLTGCTTYVDRAPPVVYEEPPPVQPVTPLVPTSVEVV